MMISRALALSALVCSLSAPVLAQDRTGGAPPPPATQPPAGTDRQTPTDRQQPQDRVQEMRTIAGQLVSVDAKAKMFTIKTAAGTNMAFSYTEATKVNGADEGVNGLATKSGTDVTVHYTERGQENVAAQIDVQKPKV